MRRDEKHVRRVKASSSPGRRHHLISPGIACYVCAPLSPPEHVKFHAPQARRNFDVIWMQGRSPEKEPPKPYRSLSFSATALPAALLLRRCHLQNIMKRAKHLVLHHCHLVVPLQKIFRLFAGDLISCRACTITEKSADVLSATMLMAIS